MATRARLAGLGLAAAIAGALLTGCGSQVVPSAHPSQAQPTPTAPAPSPVSTQATLSGRCAMGWEWDSNGTSSADGIFRAGAYPSSGAFAPGSSSGDPVLAYRLMLTNKSAVTADVAGFAVAFYDASGTEARSDEETASGFITPGQSLTWTVIEDQSVSGYGDDPNQQLAQTGNIPSGAATCQLVQWTHP